MNKLGRWTVIAVGLLLLGFSFTAPLSQTVPRSVQYTWEFGHVVLFFCLAHSAIPFLLTRVSGHSRLVSIVMAASLLLALAIEAIQAQVGRSFSLDDIILDLGGSIIALCMLYMKPGMAIPALVRRSLSGLSILLLIYGLAPVMLAVVDEYHMRRQFPRLAGFESVLEFGRWSGPVSPARLISENGSQRVMQLNFGTQRYSTVSLDWFEGNWLGFETLVISAYLPGSEQLALTLKINDETHYREDGGAYEDRYNGVLQLKPGWNHLELALADIENAPANRQMDMAQVTQFNIFSTSLPRVRQLYLGSIGLK